MNHTLKAILSKWGFIGTSLSDACSTRSSSKLKQKSVGQTLKRADVVGSTIRETDTSSFAKPQKMNHTLKAILTKGRDFTSVTIVALLGTIRSVILCMHLQLTYCYALAI